MTRREFLKAVAGTAIFFTARSLFPVNRDLPDDTSGSQVNIDLAMVKSRDYVKGVEKAIELIGGIKRYVKPGDIVVVKPNMAFNSQPELKANTDPVIVRTVIDLCYQALASKVYVFDRSLSNPKLTYTTSGIAEAAKAAGAKVVFVNEVSRKLYPAIAIKDAHFLKETTVNRYILESDVLINVPVAKQHSSAGLTIGMKNLMGITGDNRSKWHWELHEAISDINLGVRSNLTVVDATNLMIRNGPTGGSTDYLRRHDTVIASSNVLSADAVTAGLFGTDPRKIGYIALGSEKGIGKIEGFSSRHVTL
ncbi:MAG: DUF362 domain-containing protein [Spirochaetota bacterium]|nr:MAG: DUF362 domain-containing protein [Spirochaetota bacterium]